MTNGERRASLPVMNDAAASPTPTPAAVRWLGHATVLLELDGVRVLTDPVLRPRVGPLVRVARAAGGPSAGRVDACSCRHLHADHVDPPSLRRIGSSVPILAPRGAARWLRRRGAA